MKKYNKLDQQPLKIIKEVLLDKETTQIQISLLRIFIIKFYCERYIAPKR